MLRVASVVACATLAALAMSATISTASSTTCSARFSSVFQPHMVLQRRRPINVFGYITANGNTATNSTATGSPPQITVALGDAATTSAAIAGGRWSVTLPAMEATAANQIPLNLTMTFSSSGGDGLDGSNSRNGGSGGIINSSVGVSTTTTLTDIVVGDVVLCSGQSNIDVPQSYGHQTNATAQQDDEDFAARWSERLRLMIVPNQLPNLGSVSPSPLPHPTLSRIRAHAVFACLLSCVCVGLMYCCTSLNTDSRMECVPCDFMPACLCLSVMCVSLSAHVSVPVVALPLARSLCTRVYSSHTRCVSSIITYA